MNRWLGRRAPHIAATAILALATAASAQNVSVSSSAIRIFETTGNEVVEINFLGDYHAGGGGVNADVTLRKADGEILFAYNGATGVLTLGGGSDDGEIRLRDDDGTTTTIHLEGRTGLLQLGSPNEDGDLQLWDNDPDDELSIRLNGASGNVTNQLGGNGLVKAWATITQTGAISACWRCNTNSAETQKLGEGVYEVDFTPLATDISSRAALCSTSDMSNPLALVWARVSCVLRSDDPSSAYVRTWNANGELSDSAFTIMLF